jgi:hypothetical protein
MAVPYTFGTATSSIPLSQLDSNFNTVITLGNTAIQLGNTVTTLNNMTLANVTISSGNVTITNVTITTANVTTANIGTAFVSGNVSFTSTGNRITGDFSNGTVANRVMFQSSTVNGASRVGIHPNGTNAAAEVLVLNNSDTTNAGFGSIRMNASDFGITSTFNGAGTYLPMTFYTGGSERIRIDTSGFVLMGTNTTLPVNLASGIFQVLQTGATGHAACFNTNATSGFAAAAFSRDGNNGAVCEFGYDASTTVGSISVTSVATTYNVTSDYRLKNVVGAVSDSGSRIDALEPVEYTWKSNGLRTRGFLAHKFQEVYAQSVTGTKDEIDADGNPVYQEMQASTAEVIADLIAEIQSLRKRLTALEST